MRHKLRQALITARFEDIAEDLTYFLPGALTGKTGDAGAGAKVDRPDIIEAEDVIGMAMSNEDCIEKTDARAQRLLAKIAGSIDNKLAFIMLDQNRCAQA